MYKFTNNLAHGKFVLVRKKVGDGTCALLVMRAPKRSYAAPKPLPHPKEPVSSNPVFWGTVGASILTGAAVVYCKGNSDARNWLASNAPWADNFIALVYQENTTYGKAFSNKVSQAASAVSDFVFGKEGVSPPERETLSMQDLNKDFEKLLPKDYILPPPAFSPLFVQEKQMDEPEVETPATVVQTEKCEIEKPEPIVITKDLVDLEQDMHEATKSAIDNYKKATTASTNYNKALYKIIEATIGDLNPSLFGNLAGAQGERDSGLKAAKAAHVKAKCALDTLERLLDAGVQAPPEAVASTRRYIKKFRTDLAAAEKKFNEEHEKSVISDKYWNKVEAARNNYKEELQLLFPGIDLSSRRLDVKGDTDLLLIYMLKQVHFLQNELAEMQTVQEGKLSRAIECHDEKEIIEARVEDLVKREKIQKEIEYQKKALLMKAEADKQLREQLQKQMEVQQEVLRNLLDKKEKEVLAKFAKQVSEQIEKERLRFKTELAAMAGKLTAIENTLKQRTKAEEETKKSQTLWAAAEALHAATKRGCAREVKIDKELDALEKAAQGDNLVMVVLKGLPAETKDKPIITETTLREKFDAMEKTAMKVALVSKNGSSLPVYFLSWVQSKLLFSRISEIPEEELENKPIDFTLLDTFEIMHRARYYMDHGNIPAALRYVNLLQGAPRAAARNWCDAAKRHLEIKQAAEAVMAHASAASIIHLNQLQKDSEVKK